MSKKRRPRFWESPVFWLVALIAGALVATIAMSAGDSDDANPASDRPETGAVQLVGTALPPFEEPDSAIGQVAPTISAQTLQGGGTQIAAVGTARLYGFFAHWCSHCQRELPRVATWLETNDLPAGVDLVAISTAVEPTAENYPPSDWFTREHWPTTVLMDDVNGTIANGFGLTGFPYWVATNADGEVVARASGELSTAQFESLLAMITTSDAGAQ
jgi:thiol-disulfide isomerase/thioredoxin